MSKPSLNGKRIVVAVPLSIILLCLENYYLDLGLFGQFGKKILVVSVGLLIVAVLFFGSTVKELQDYRDRKRISSR